MYNYYYYYADFEALNFSSIFFSIYNRFKNIAILRLAAQETMYKLITVRITFM